MFEGRELDMTESDSRGEVFGSRAHLGQVCVHQNRSTLPCPQQGGSFHSHVRIECIIRCVCFV